LARAIERKSRGVTRIAMRDRQIGEQPGHAGVENGDGFPRQAFCPSAQASQLLPRPAAPVMSRLRALGDPIAGAEFEERRDPARAGSGN